MKTNEEKIASLQKRLRKPIGVKAQSLKNVYGPHAVDVLTSYMTDPAGGRPVREEYYGPRRSKIRYKSNGGNLPTIEEYNTLRDKQYTQSLSSLIEDAYGVIDELKDECEEIVGNAEGTNFENTDRIQRFSETVDALSDISEPSGLRFLSDELTVVRLPTITHRTGRASKLDDAIVSLELAATTLEELSLNSEGTDREVYEEIMDEIRGHIDDCANVEFPGMYG